MGQNSAAAEAELFGHYAVLTAANEQEKREFEGVEIEGRIKKTANLNPNEAHIKILNLSDESRKFLTTRNMPVVLDAGYTDHHGQIFKGTLEQFNHHHEPTGWESELVCYSSLKSLRDAVIVKTFKKGTDLKPIFKHLIKELTDKSKENPLHNKIAGLKPGIILGGEAKLALAIAKASQAKRKRKKLTQQEKISKAITRVNEQTAAKLARADRKLQKARSIVQDLRTELKNIAASNGMDVIETDDSISVVPNFTPIHQDIVLLDSSNMLETPQDLENHEKRKGGFRFTALLHYDINPATIFFVSHKNIEGPFYCSVVEHFFNTHRSELQKSVIEGIPYA